MQKYTFFFILASIRPIFNFTRKGISSVKRSKTNLSFIKKNSSLLKRIWPTGIGRFLSSGMGRKLTKWSILPKERNRECHSSRLVRSRFRVASELSPSWVGVESELSPSWVSLASPQVRKKGKKCDATPMLLLRSSSVPPPIFLRSSSALPPLFLRSSSVLPPFFLRSNSALTPLFFRSNSV